MKAWRTATAISDFHQREPTEGAAATEMTEVRVIASGDMLYVGIVAHDRHPEQIVSRILARDKIMETEFDGKPNLQQSFGGTWRSAPCSRSPQSCPSTPSRSTTASTNACLRMRG